LKNKHDTEESYQEVKEEFVDVSLSEKLAYGFANMPGTFFGGAMGVIQSFYYAWMGLASFWITIAQIIYAIWNMVNDPLFGNMINNTKFFNKRRGEYQRYIPYIKYGAPLFSLCFALVFFPPGAWRGGTGAIQFWLFVWYLVSQVAYDTLFTIVLCAWVALAPQMTLDQREREKIQLISSAFGLPAILIGFVLPVIYLSNPTPDSVASFQFLVIIIAIFGVIPYLILSRVVREHSEYLPEETEGLISSIKKAFKNRSFIIYVIYDGLSVFIINSLVVSLPFYLTWVLGQIPDINILLFWIAPIICLIAGIVIVLYISKEYSTKKSITYYLGIMALGFFLTFIVGFTKNWILISGGVSVFMLGFAGDFIQHNPMRADTIDYDFWKISGERREGLYAGIGALFSKPMISVALAVPPAIMTAFGLVYVASAGGLQPTQGLELAYLSVNISFALIPGIASLICLIIWVKYYPLTGEVVEEMKKEVHLMHEERRTKYEEGRREEKQ